MTKQMENIIKVQELRQRIDNRLTQITCLTRWTDKNYKELNVKCDKLLKMLERCRILNRKLYKV